MQELLPLPVELGASLSLRLCPPPGNSDPCAAGIFMGSPLSSHDCSLTPFSALTSRDGGGAENFKLLMAWSSW